MKHLLEVCVDSVESALAAAEGGADRLELCANLIIGGTSPGPFLLEAVQKAVKLPVNVLIRPRFGDFCYTQYEIDLICAEIASCRALGANGVVVGALSPDGALDLAAMERFAGMAQGMQITLHRAFDVCADAMQTIRQAKQLGVSTILTSGQQATATQGKELLRKLVQQADGITIMAGSGVDASVIPQLAEAGIRAFHMSGKVTVSSCMQYRREGVPMGLPLASEYELYYTSAEKVKAAKNALQRLLR